jgi:hypothetical protein
MPKWVKSLKVLIYQYFTDKIISKNLLLYHQNWPYDQMVFGQPACFTSYLLRPQIWSSSLAFSGLAPCDVLSSTPRVRAPAMTRWHCHLYGLATIIRETCGLEFQVISLQVKGEEGRLNRDGIWQRNRKRASHYRLALQFPWSGRLDSGHWKTIDSLNSHSTPQKSETKCSG